jgi:hypothetical protein
MFLEGTRMNIAQSSERGHRSGLPSAAILGLALAGLGLGCVARLDEMAAEEAVDSHELALNESALVANSAEDMEGGAVDAAALAARAETRALTRYQPAGCASTTRQGNVLTHVLNRCSGRRGLAQMTGTVIVTFADVAAGVQVAVVSDNLKVNRAMMNVNATGLVSFDGPRTTLAVTSTGDGVGPRGNRFVRTGQFTAVADATTECLDLNGSWQLTVGGASRSTAIKSLKVCKDSCPVTGTIDHRGFRGREVTVTFDGSTEASWSSSAGRSGTVEMQCAPIVR